MNNNRKKKTQTQTPGEERLKSFLDMIAPSVIQFYTDHYICGNTFRSVWALREYPTATDEQAILRHLGEKDGVTLRIYTRQVTPAEEKKIISNAANKNRMKQGNTENLQETVTAASNLQDVTNIIATMHRNREPLLHTAVYLELSAADMDKLKLLQTEVLTELIRSKLNVDKLLLRQKQGFLCVHPAGRNVFLEQFERALPASSVANLFPFNYSGKTDKNGFYIGRDKFGSNVIVDFNQRADDKTNGRTAACIDEFYLFLTNLTAVEYIRNFMKRVRKKDSAVILASQNLEDFNIDGIREYTKPLFSIPTHVFLFNAGNIDSKFYIDTLQLEQSEYNLIRYPQRGVCLYKCGNERYNLMVHAPEYKEKLFGSAGGR